jgi:hypothetical protein
LDSGFSFPLAFCFVRFYSQIPQEAYNSIVPTPFYHLSVAEDLFQHPGLSSEARSLLQTHRSAFLLGNTAPDVQTISGQDRQTTHFYDVHIRPNSRPAWERMLDLNPALANPRRLPDAQAVFVSGYLCHLQADWDWLFDIYFPVFGPYRSWHSFRRRLYLHNVLRSYLDETILAHLAAGIGAELGQAIPVAWLPFVEDGHMFRWRDLLVSQLEPGAIIQTVEVFAARQNIPPQAYYQLMGSEERLESEIFAHLPRQALEDYYQRLLERNVLLINHYFGNNEHH